MKKQLFSIVDFVEAINKFKCNIENTYIGYKTPKEASTYLIEEQFNEMFYNKYKEAPINNVFHSYYKLNEKKHSLLIIDFINNETVQNYDDINNANTNYDELIKYCNEIFSDYLETLNLKKTTVIYIFKIYDEYFFTYNYNLKTFDTIYNTSIL